MRKLGSILFFSLLVVFLTSFSNLSGLTWGFFAHRLINRKAVFLLPAPLFTFYKSHLEFLEEHAVDPDKRRYAVVGEAECHYIDLDNYEVDSSYKPIHLPEQWLQAVKMFGEDSLRKHGIGPWNTYFVFKKLEQSFLQKDLNKILKYSAELGHYIGDMHVPLHTTSNYNGQKTGQNGIHGLWETRLPELFHSTYDWSNSPASYVDNPQSRIWQCVIASHALVQPVLRIEDSLSQFYLEKKYGFEYRGATTVKVYAKDFSSQYHQSLDNMVQSRMKSAIKMLADMIFTAWVNAGEPDLSTLVSRKMNSNELDSLKTRWKRLKIREIEH